MEGDRPIASRARAWRIMRRQSWNSWNNAEETRGTDEENELPPSTILTLSCTQPYYPR